MNFSEAQIERYSRHILLQEIGGEGQEKICRAKVLVIGAGGLGAPVIYYLAAAGVGTIGVVDGDKVELSNLQRQILHFTSDVGTDKTLSAKEKIQLLNPDTRVETFHAYLTAGNARDILKNYDFVVECTDNFEAKYLVNDTCILLRKPFSIGGISRFEGQTLTVLSGTACYRCLYPEPPDPNNAPSCSRAGVLGAIAGMLGTIQATEVLKYITGTGTLLTNRLLTFDAKRMAFLTLKLAPNSHCGCGHE
ncbi:MAG: HesA/MoeB/ThiF family protein [Bacteroidales bacterium]|jgi:molybdopterin/thiamine biosynthesis adenylyltransferase|nr:HesA/MoeB/ThiF family protein [Bacteroidales bacterium]